MSNRSYKATLRLFGGTLALLFLSGSLHPTFAQLQRFERSASKAKRASDPVTNLNHHSGAHKDSKQEAIEQAIEAGNQSRSKNDYQTALDKYQQAQKLAPQDARSFYGIGNLYSDLLCYASAIEAYNRALELNKDYLEARLGLAGVYADDDRYSEAEEQFKKILAADSRHLAANIGLGIIYANTGKYQQALDKIKPLINAASAEDRSAAHLALGDVYLGPNNWEEAIAEYEKAIALQPNLAEAYLKLGIAQMHFGIARSEISNFKEAKTEDIEKLTVAAKLASNTIRRAIGLNKHNHPIVHAILGRTLSMQMNYPEATNEINLYFKELTKLEKQLPPLASKCDSGFNVLRAAGYMFMGEVYFWEANFQVDARQETELLNKAIEQGNQAIKLKYDFAPAYDMMGTVYAEQKKYEDAARHFQKAISFKTDASDKADTYQMLGGMYGMMGKDHVDLALQHLERALELNPNDSQTCLLLALTYVNNNKYDLAISIWKKAIKIKPEDPKLYVRLGETYTYNPAGSRPDDALINYRKAADYDPNNAEIYLKIAFVYAYRKDDTESAIVALKKAIELKPDYLEAHLDLSGRYAHKADYDEAIKWLKKALQIKPDSAEAFYDLGRMYNFKGDHEEALRRLKKAIEIKPEMEEAYVQLGRVYQEYLDGSKADEGLAYLKKALELNPKDAYAYFVRGSIYARVKKNDDEAILNFKQAIDLDSEDFYAYLELGRAYHRKKNDVEATKQLLKAVALNPAYPYAYRELADIYGAQKNYPEATKHLLSAIKYNSEARQEYIDLVGIYKVQKNYNEAINLLTTAIKSDPNNYFWHKEMAKVYEEQDSNDKAVKYYRDAIRLFDGDDSSVKELYQCRIERLEGHYPAAIDCFQKLNFRDDPNRRYFEIGVVYIVSKNQRAARQQYQQLVRLNSPLAEELLAKINMMK